MAEAVRENLTARFGENGFIMVQVAVAGASLTWENPDRNDWATSDELPDHLVSSLRNVATSNPTAHVAGMIWVQGESDTRQGADPQIYDKRLKGLVERIQDEVPGVNTAAGRSFADMKVVISQLAETSQENFERVGWDTVIYEQGRLGILNDGYEIVDPDAVARKAGVSASNMFSDALHYSNSFNHLLADKLIQKVVEPNLPDIAATTPITGNAQAEILTGSSANDLIRGRGGKDQLSGEGGDDRILGGRSDDLISGGTGDDRIFGGIGNDVVRGGSGSDYIQGGGGKDRIWGGDGADFVYGGTWRDILHGGRGDDFLVGGAGRDVLHGGKGNDVLTGGRAGQSGDGTHDTFVFINTVSNFPEYDRIKDFESGVDQIDVSDFAYGSFHAVLGRMVETPYGVEVTLSGDHFLLIQGADIADFSAQDFLL